jgi:hypothetical protein
MLDIADEPVVNILLNIVLPLENDSAALRFGASPWSAVSDRDQKPVIADGVC